MFAKIRNMFTTLAEAASHNLTVKSEMNFRGKSGQKQAFLRKMFDRRGKLRAGKYVNSSFCSLSHICHTSLGWKIVRVSNYILACDRDCADPDPVLHV